MLQNCHAFDEQLEGHFNLFPLPPVKLLMPPEASSEDPRPGWPRPMGNTAPMDGVDEIDCWNVSL